MKKLETKIINVTPNSLNCAGIACPSIFKTHKGTYVVIGKMLTKEELTEEIENKVGEGEIAIEVPEKLLF